MIYKMVSRLFKAFLVCFLHIVILTVCRASPVYSEQLVINILAVNGTDQPKQKKITHYLPQELSKDDILDTAGLILDYDFQKAAFFVSGDVTLNPKQTKTFKIRINDIWKIDKKDIEEIKQQIDASLERVRKDERLYAAGQKRKDNLYSQLDYIISEQEKFADNIEKRIDNFRL